MVLRAITPLISCSSFLSEMEESIDMPHESTPDANSESASPRARAAGRGEASDDELSPASMSEPDGVALTEAQLQRYGDLIKLSKIELVQKWVLSRLHRFPVVEYSDCDFDPRCQMQRPESGQLWKQGPNCSAYHQRRRKFEERSS
jgi:hypothetical protein